MLFIYLDAPVLLARPDHRRLRLQLRLRQHRRWIVGSSRVAAAEVASCRRRQEVSHDAEKVVGDVVVVSVGVVGFQRRDGGLAADHGGRLPDLPVDPFPGQDERSSQSGGALTEARYS